MIPVKSGKRSVFNSERRVAESFTWSLTTTRAEKISGCVKRRVKNASVAPFVSVGSFVRSFVGRSFGRSFARLLVSLFACSLLIVLYSPFVVYRSSFAVRSFVRSSINRKVSRSCLRSVDRSFVRPAVRSFSLSIDWSVHRNHKTHFDTSKDVMAAGAELSSLANAVCIVSLCLSTRRLLHTLNGTKQKKKSFSNLFESGSNSWFCRVIVITIVSEWRFDNLGAGRLSTKSGIKGLVECDGAIRSTHGLETSVTSTYMIIKYSPAS